MDQTPENQTSANGAERQPKQDVSTVIRPPPAAIQQPPPPPPEDSNPKKRRPWTNDPGIFWVGVVGVIAAITYAAITYWGNVITQNQGRAQLVIADSPASLIKVTTDNSSSPDRSFPTIEGKFYIANRGPSVAKNVGFDFAVTFEPIGYPEILGGQGFGRLLDLGPNGTPTEIPFRIVAPRVNWLFFHMYGGGQVHVRSRVTFEDVYGNIVKPVFDLVDRWPPEKWDTQGYEQLAPKLFVLIGPEPWRHPEEPQPPQGP